MQNYKNSAKLIPTSQQIVQRYRNDESDGDWDDILSPDDLEEYYERRTIRENDSVLNVIITPDAIITLWKILLKVNCLSTIIPMGMLISSRRNTLLSASESITNPQKLRSIVETNFRFSRFIDPPWFVNNKRLTDYLKSYLLSSK